MSESPPMEQWDRSVQLRCLEITQPIGLFYVGIMDAADIVRISYSDVRRIASERRAVETYLGIERPLNPKRVSQLKEYVTTVDASFPSAIIVALESKNTRYSPSTQVLSIKDAPDVAKILDGQHRIAGLEGRRNGTFQVIVTVFVDMDIAEQAMVFATINLEQTKVNKSLAYDLYEYTRHRSPQKTCHNIVRLLDIREGSPFHGKIKILGTAGDPGETLSQAVFIDMLLPLMSREPLKDRDAMKRGKKPERATPADASYLIFRNMFLDDQDEDIALVLWNYFGAVEDRWQDYWRSVRQGFILNRTAGFRGLMLFLPYAYNELGGAGSVPERAEFLQLLSRVRIDGTSFTPENYPPGTSGQTRLRDHLRSQTGL